MPKHPHLSKALVLAMATVLTGCGTRPPKLAEAWEAKTVNREMVFQIKRNIFCEMVDAVRKINGKDTNFGKPIPDDYGVQLQLSLTVAESSAFSPTATGTRTLSDAKQSGVDISRNLNLGITANASSTATRTDTSYSYWIVGAITPLERTKEFCDDWPIVKNSSLLTSDLGIRDFLEANVKSTVLLHSSKPSGGKKIEKIDVYSYSLKFAVVTSGGISPTFQLKSLSGGGEPILNLSRSRTQELILTFGPTGPDGFQPSQVSLSQHLNTELNATLSKN